MVLGSERRGSIGAFLRSSSASHAPGLVETLKHRMKPRFHPKGGSVFYPDCAAASPEAQCSTCEHGGRKENSGGDRHQLLRWP